MSDIAKLTLDALPVLIAPIWIVVGHEHTVHTFVNQFCYIVHNTDAGIYRAFRGVAVHIYFQVISILKREYVSAI